MVCCGLMDTSGVFFGCSIFCARFCWFVMGIILMVNLASMRDSSEYNKSIANEYEIINECADDFAKVDIQEL